jgi:hypothetical protein
MSHSLTSQRSPERVHAGRPSTGGDPFTRASAQGGVPGNCVRAPARTRTAWAAPEGTLIRQAVSSRRETSLQGPTWRAVWQSLQCTRYGVSPFLQVLRCLVETAALAGKSTGLAACPFNLSHSQTSKNQISR